MRIVPLFIAGFILAASAFVATMLISPPTSEAAAVANGTATASTPLVLVGP
jgi:hypothetical protein